MYYIKKKFPRAPLLGLGFSLGANVMTRYLAEEGEDSRMAAACAVACVGYAIGYTAYHSDYPVILF